jgi:hypothetical protein
MNEADFDSPYPTAMAGNTCDNSGLMQFGSLSKS